MGKRDIAKQDNAERRAEARAGIALMRAAKLVTQSGEFVCLLRDVTSDGVRLRFFHAVPQDSHVLLETATGETFALIRAWQDECSAGYQFAAPVEPAMFLAQRGAEAAAELALRVSAAAVVRVRGESLPVRLTAISQRGAHIESARFLALGQPLLLAAAGLGEVGGWVHWRNGTAYGVIFEGLHRLDQLAEQALRINAGNEVALAVVA